MSLLEEVHEHPGEHYLDFEDSSHVHNMAVFGLGAQVLRREVEIELEQLGQVTPESAADPDN